VPLTDRRRYPRFAVNPAYSPAMIRPLLEDEFRRACHVIDISEGGIRLEADVAVEPGTPVALRIDLPDLDPGFAAYTVTQDGPGRAVFATGNVVWCDCEEPGPAGIAVAITRYARDTDLERLRRRLDWGGWAIRAA